MSYSGQMAIKHNVNDNMNFPYVQQPISISNMQGIAQKTLVKPHRTILELVIILLDVQYFFL